MDRELTVGIASVQGPASEERRLLERARKGDERAFAELIRGFDPAARMLAYRLLGDREAMEDALQEAYVKAFLGLSRFRRRAALQTWLYRIVYNCCLDQLKRRPVAGTSLASEEVAPLTDTAERVATRTSLDAALSSLAPLERTAVLLVDGLGLGYEEAAAVVGVPRGTIASRLSRARGALRRSLGEAVEGGSE